MTSLAREIRDTPVQAGTLAIWYLAQAGFCLKTSAGKLIYLDPYLSDCCERLFGFRRLIPTPIEAAEVEPGLLISTHAHADHLDPDALATIAAHPATRFVGAFDCEPVYSEHGISRGRYTLLRPGETAAFGEVTIRAVYADHGELAPEAIGVLITADGITVYDVGDSAFRPDEIMRSLDRPVDVMIAPINGAFGNLDAAEACKLAALVRPKLLIASHFGMFAEHGGNPERFLEEARGLPDGIRALVMAPGDKLVVAAD